MRVMLRNSLLHRDCVSLNYIECGCTEHILRVGRVNVISSLYGVRYSGLDLCVFLSWVSVAVC